MNLSSFGKKFSGDAGILSLMDDLGNALAQGNMIMMGGGNPGYIPAIEAVMKQRLQSILDNDEALRTLVGIYDPPQGKGDFLYALAELLQREYHWPIGPENICLTNGSQSAFFILFNMFAGRYPDGGNKKILLPMAPEYIGYADLGLEEDFFVSVRPRIEERGHNRFKYRVDFSSIRIGADIGAMCVSRPTNPTGNVLTDKEIEGLIALAAEHSIPLIIDSAYGIPFPGMVYTHAVPVWNENVIVSMSLSKFGLPATRTGIVLAKREIIQAISGINSVVNLAPGSLGAMLTAPLMTSGEILRLSNEVICPWYKKKMERAMEVIDQALMGCPYRVHAPEGAMFLWFWFPDLPVSSATLYERLKERGVVVVSGHYFFPGLQEDWPHMRECIRVNYSQEDKDVHEGIRIIADEVKKIYQKGR
ncbi:MAG: valine--pyruvate transaminase [Desulfobulbus propionicus]|nr:MAG: valine--pyruvate transaminase [Desulfobulbus propionicus]